MKAKASFPLRIDSVTENVLKLAAASSGIIVLMILGFLWLEVQDFPHFPKIFTDQNWNPTEGQFNMWPMLVGTLAATAGAILLCVPFGVLSGLFLRLYAPKKLAIIFRRSLEILSGIPSVVYGFWGLTTLVPFINEFAPPGAGLFSAVIVLALMIVPTTSLMMDAAFRSVKNEELRQVQSMGLGNWGAFRLVLLPKTLPALITATLLSTGRAIGETMAVLMVAGNIVQVPSGIFEPIRTMTANIALELGYAEGEHRAALFACGFILMCLILLLVFISSLSERKFRVEV